MIFFNNRTIDFRLKIEENPKKYFKGIHNLISFSSGFLNLNIILSLLKDPLNKISKPFNFSKIKDLWKTGNNDFNVYTAFQRNKNSKQIFKFVQNSR